jgi:hypothetical protein
MLPKFYRPGKPLEVKIKEITKKGSRLLLKFDEEFLKKQLDKNKIKKPVIENIENDVKKY